MTWSCFHCDISCHFSLGGMLETYQFAYAGPFGAMRKRDRVIHVTEGYWLEIETEISQMEDGSWRSQPLERAVNKPMTESEWNHIKSAIDEACFWTMPAALNNRRGLDGTDWLLEGYKSTPEACTNRDYHFVFRWTPDSSSRDFIELCETFADLDSTAERLRYYRQWHH